MSLTQEQSGAVDFLVDAVLTKKEVVGFIAPGGCGKTYSLKHFQNDPRMEDRDITFTATTNKAAGIMKGDGVGGAMTLHSAISTHIPTEEFQHIVCAYETRKKEGMEVDLNKQMLSFLKKINVKPEDFYSYRNEKELIAENGISPFDDLVFSHYGTSEHKGGVVAIDEASMLPTKSKYNDEGKLKAIGLDIAKKVFDTVILVGDDSQLPPINGKSSFEDIEKTTLTVNMRANKGLLRVLDYARAGGNLANYVPEEREPVSILASLSNNFFAMDDLIENNVAHIVYKNKTRKYITKRIRGSLEGMPTENEPIIYKGVNIDDETQSISKNETGVFNGMVGVWENYKQAIDGRNFDEYNDGYTYLQYAYAITAHTSQGSSFDNVVVHIDDIPHFIDSETRRKWIYTALSRARKSITVVY